jgi:hypothetical protein
MTRETVTLIEDGDDLILPLSANILASTGWIEGDTIKWTDNGNGSWTMSKAETSTPEEEEAWQELERKKGLRDK